MQSERSKSAGLDARLDGWRGGWLSNARHLNSPNADDRPAGTRINLLVIHYISLPAEKFSGDTVQRLFLNQLNEQDDPSVAALTTLRVSAHFFIRRRGEVIQFVPIQRRAWHAGVSKFLDVERCNDFSIGVELEGSARLPFTSAQYRALHQLTSQLQTVLPLQYCAGHSDIAPGRKVDPGPQFDWKNFLNLIKLPRPQVEGQRFSK